MPEARNPPPKQYGTDGRCAACNCKLSRYNPYVVCAPCRLRMGPPDSNPFGDPTDPEDDSPVPIELWPRRQSVYVPVDELMGNV